jgi:hypothetical protein
MKVPDMKVNVEITGDAADLVEQSRRFNAMLQSEVERAYRTGFDAGYQAALPSDRDEMKTVGWVNYLKPWFGFGSKDNDGA